MMARYIDADALRDLIDGKTPILKMGEQPKRCHYI